MASAARTAIDAAANAFRALAFDQRMAAGLFAALALLPLLSPILGSSYLLLVGERVLIFAIAAISLELLIGAGGLVSFGHAAFLGIGAYAAGIAASHGLGTLLFALPAALAASALFALLTGAIAVRTRGVYFIMITLAFGQMAFFVAGSLAPYGGDDGLSWPGRTQVFGTRVLENRVVFFYATLALAAASYLFVSRLVASRFGRVLRGLTDSETRMQAIGFAPYRFRLTVYVIAGTMCGLAGFLLGNQAEFVSPAYMHWQRSGELIVMVLLGGTGTLYGPVLGALALLVLEESLARLTEHWKAILGPLLVLVVLFARGGIAGSIEAWRQRRMTPAQLLARLQVRAHAAVVRIEHFVQPAIAGARRGAVQLGAGAELSIGAMNRTLASLAASADRRLAAGLAHSVRCWQAVLRPRLDSLVALSRRGAAQMAARARPWTLALHRALKSASGSAMRGISAAVERWRRR
jgi:branched-chain amino acid transport system permease protein